MGFADWLRNKRTEVTEWLRNRNMNDEPSVKRSWSFRRRSKSKKKEKMDKLETQSNKELTTNAKQPDKKMTASQKRKVRKTLTSDETKSAKDKKKTKKKSKNTPDVQFQEVVNTPNGDANKKRLGETAAEEIQVVKNIETGNENQLPVPQTLSDYETKTLTRIDEILEKSREFEGKIDTFSDGKGSQAFYYIDENLQRNIDKLDRIDIRDSVELRTKRKDAIKMIYDAIEKLETKATEYESGRSRGSAG